MKIYGFFVLFAYIMVLIVPSALGNEDIVSRVFRFHARTLESISNEAYLDGEYDVGISDGKCEVTQEIKGVIRFVAGDHAAELCRMIGIDPDQRMYIDPPHKINQMWSKSHKYRVPRLPGMEFERIVTYKVVGYEELPTPAGTFKTFKIEGHYEKEPSQWTEAFKQKWVYYYAEDIGKIVKWRYDSSVGKKGAKIEIELIQSVSGRDVARTR